MRDMVQVRITAPGKMFIPEGYVRHGQVLWVRRDRAEVMINKQQIAEPAAIGPTETKPAGPTEKKESAGDAPASPSTDSAKSPESGMVESSSLSPAGQASTPSSSGAPKKRGRKPKSA